MAKHHASRAGALTDVNGRPGATTVSTRMHLPLDPTSLDDSHTRFGAICPRLGKGAALAMPFADTEAMPTHLCEISTAVPPGAHAMLVLDQAGWHGKGTMGVGSVAPTRGRCPSVLSAGDVAIYSAATRRSERDGGGKTAEKVVPRPASLCTVSLPPWRAISSETMERPSPTPSIR